MNRPDAALTASDLDPQHEFALRAARDRTRIVHLAAALRIECDWRDVAASHLELEELAHGLAGTGGTFGFPGLSDAAARVERLTERRRLRPSACYTKKQILRLSAAIARLLTELDIVAQREIQPA